MNNLCEYAEQRNQGIAKYLWCIKVNEICPFCRYCTNDKCLKMTNKYTQCKVRMNDGKKEEK